MVASSTLNNSRGWLSSSGVASFKRLRVCVVGSLGSLFRGPSSFISDCFFGRCLVIASFVRLLVSSNIAVAMVKRPRERSKPASLGGRTGYSRRFSHYSRLPIRLSPTSSKLLMCGPFLFL